jgi:hypothetical protein
MVADDADEITGAGLMVRFAPLSAPVVAGLEATTRILYPAPAVVPAGIVAVIGVVLVKEDNVPIETGAAKLPLALDSCAVKTLPLIKLPLMVKFTVTEVPAQMLAGVIVLVKISVIPS